MIKDIKKSIRITRAELETIQAKADKLGTTITNVFRSGAMGYKIKSKYDKEHNYQLSKIGNNLNQIARKLNSGNINNISIIKNQLEIIKLLKAIK